MKQTEQWTSKLGFIMAAAGSAIGLGANGSFLISPGRAGILVLTPYVPIVPICVTLYTSEGRIEKHTPIVNAE